MITLPYISTTKIYVKIEKLLWSQYCECETFLKHLVIIKVLLVSD
jgi:hypothetical protein